jgi:hypothetical protein
VVNPRHAPQAGAPAARIHQDVLRTVQFSDRFLRAAAVTGGGSVLVGVIVIWVVVPWGYFGIAIALSAFWVLLCGFLALGADNLIVFLAVRKFNRHFPQKSAERPAALRSLSRLITPNKAAQKMRLALGLIGPEEAPEASVQAALDQLSGPLPLPTPGPSAPADPGSLHLGPSPLDPTSPLPPGKARPDFIPLDLQERPDSPAPQTPEGVRFGYVPLQPLEKPADAKEPKPS